MIYEVEISVFGQKLSITVKADDRAHLAERVRDEIKVERFRVVDDKLAQLASVLNLKELVR